MKQDNNNKDKNAMYLFICGFCSLLTFVSLAAILLSSHDVSVHTNTQLTVLQLSESVVAVCVVPTFGAIASAILYIKSLKK